MLKHKKKAHDSQDAAPGGAAAAATAAPATPFPPAAAAPNPTVQPAPTPPATPPPPPLPSPAEIELAALKDKHLRLQADFDNFRKRQTREREEFARRANEALLHELLPVLDHLELALASAPDKDAPLAKGLRLVVDHFLNALARFDLKPFHAAGEPFDPNRHEALSEQPSPDVPAARVLHQVRPGYNLGGRLLRPAQVIVSSGQPAAAAAAPVETPPAAPADADEDPED